ncbi:hypothetical protein, partial [Kitasatospora sp. NPDC056531]|uniref:hypothetical protein n=1 Tax=Kitasatospora sp. NPDC056531 TaxID=3345856 RepID=UPI00367793E0
MEQAIEEGRRNERYPFGAVIVRSDRVVARGGGGGGRDPKPKKNAPPPKTATNPQETKLEGKNTHP